MVASAAQVANDMTAQAQYFRGRDAYVEKVFASAARIIRALVAGEFIDNRVVAGMETGLACFAQNRLNPNDRLALSALRALHTVQELRLPEARG